jgi:hypothetical protein
MYCFMFFGVPLAHKRCSEMVGGASFGLCFKKLWVSLFGLTSLFSLVGFASEKPIWFASRHGQVSDLKVARGKNSSSWIQLRFTDTLSGPGYQMTAGRFTQTAWILLDSAGQVSKSFHYPSAGDQQSGDVAVGSDGSMVSVGAFLAETPWKLPKGSLPGHGALDAWFMRFHPSGEFDWAMAAGGFNNDVVLATWVSEKGHLWLAGMGNTLAFDNQQILVGQTGALVASFSPKAQLRWARGFPASVYAAFHDVWVDSIGRTIAVGQFMGDWVVESDTLRSGAFARPCMAVLNDEGKVIKSQLILCTGDAVFEQVTGAGDAGYALAGQYQGNMVSGSDTLVGDEGVFRPFVWWLNPGFSGYGLISLPSVATQGAPALCQSNRGGVWLGYVAASTSKNEPTSTIRVQHYHGPQKVGAGAEFAIPHATRVGGMHTTEAGTLLVWGEASDGLIQGRTRCWIQEIPMPRP